MQKLQKDTDLNLNEVFEDGNWKNEKSIYDVDLSKVKCTLDEWEKVLAK